MKKFLKWCGIIISLPFALFIIISILIYIPPVQEFIVRKAASAASAAAGMDISVGRISLSVDFVDLKFPLNLNIHRVSAVQGEDTLLCAGKITLKVQMMPLLRKQVEIDAFRLKEIRLNTGDMISGLSLKGELGELYLESHGVALSPETAAVNSFILKDTHVDICMADTAAADSAAGEPLYWQFMLHEACLENVAIGLSMPLDSVRMGVDIGSAVLTEGLVDLRKGAYSVQGFRVRNSSVRYASGSGQPAEGFDPSHIAIAGLDIGLDSVYYCGNEIRAEIKELRMKERSGLEILSGGGKIMADDGRMGISGLELKTSDSYLSVHAGAGWNISQLADGQSRTGNDGSIRAGIMADIGKNDLFRFVTGMPEELALPIMQFRKDFPAEPVRIRAGVDGSLNRMRITGVSAEIDGHVRLTAEGWLNDVTDSARMAAHLDVEGSFPDMGFARSLTGGAVVPAGRLTASLSAEGRGFDMKGGLANGKMNVAFDIDDDLMEIGSTLDADISGGNVTARMRTDIRRLDLHGLGLVAQPLEMAQVIDIDARTDMRNRHQAEVGISDIRFSTDKKTFKTEDLNFGVSMTEDSLRSFVSSGDMEMLLRTAGGIDRVADRLTRISALAARQWESRTLNLDSLRALLPEASFRLTAGDDNLFMDVLGMSGIFKSARSIGFSRLYASLDTSPAKGINSSACLYGLHTDSLRLDTITFSAVQDSTVIGKSAKPIILTGGVRAGHTDGQEALASPNSHLASPIGQFGISLDGCIFNGGARMMVRYANARNETGALIGLEAVLREGGVSLHVLPEEPVLVYRKFRSNKDNYIFLSDKGRIGSADFTIHADMKLYDERGTGLQIYSVADSTSLQDVTVGVNRIDIGEFKRIIPYMPPVEGVISAEAHYVQQKEDMFMTAIETDISSLAYSGKPLGNWTMSGVYLPMENGGHHVDGYITRNGSTLTEINGRYRAAASDEEKDSISAHMRLMRFPLEMAGAFVPEDMARLKGYAGGEFTVEGPTDCPVINGRLATDSVNVSIPMASVNLRLEDKPITVTDNKLMFDKYGIFSRGKNPYVIDGSIDFADMSNMRMDLKMTARNFEVFNAKKNRTSMVYGKMYIDLNTAIKGTPDAISVRGSANILGSSDFTYVLRESPLTVEDRLAETVTFVNFADTAAARRKPLGEMRPGGIDMMVNLHIDQAVQCKVDINESGSNYMRVEGGGDLAFRYTPDGNMLLNGRYSLMSGEMKYEMPVIPLRTFNIREGSYIEWTGNVMDPRLNIQAYERMRTSVTQEGQTARMVGFDVGVSITNRLSNLGFAFTMDAPEDGSMQNELAAMSASQKNKAAVTMLVTGMYISDSSTAKLDANSALNSYLQGQINNIAGNALKTIDLSVGMETTNATETGDQRTDYNFQFAKRFWNNRVRVVIGGKISTGNAAVRDESFIDNISLEYRLDNSGTRYVKLFHDKKYANVLEGEVTETGAGIVLKKKVSRVRELFIFQRRKKKEN